jgi:hypothetical protein
LRFSFAERRDFECNGDFSPTKNNARWDFPFPQLMFELSDKLLPMIEHAEGKYAHNLYDKLVSRIGSAKRDAKITVSGGGVQWRCVARLGPQAAEVNCFSQQGPEYLTSFQSEGEEIATARTPSSDDTVEAIRHWLDGAGLSSLYDRFAFVDQRKRELLHIRDGIVEFAPALQSCNELRNLGSGIYSLWFRNAGRSALIYFYAKNEAPNVICHWDECALFSFIASDSAALGTVLRRWLVEKAMPSVMRREFSWLAIGELADYYERGNPIEGEFIHSWNEIERFYDSEHFSAKAPVLRFISQLRLAGYDRKLRAGQSMWTFILSRSRRHGLRADQARIQFEFSRHEDSMEICARNSAEECTFKTAISLSERLDMVLTRLLEFPVE